MKPRDLFRGHWGSMGGPGGPGGIPGYPMGPSGWFVDSSDDSGGIYACIMSISDPIFSCGRTNRVFHEALVDLKMRSISITCI